MASTAIAATIERGGKSLGQPVVAAGNTRRQFAIGARRDLLDGEAGAGVDALDVTLLRTQPIDPPRRGALVEQVLLESDIELTVTAAEVRNTIARARR